MDVQVLKKMSMKTLEAQDTARALKKQPNGTIAKLARVYGIANGIKAGESDFGQYNALIGQFEGQNLETGKVYQSARLFLPGGLEEIVMSALAGSEDSRGVMFALEIQGITDDASNVGYRYTAHSLIPPATNDVLAQLRGKAMAQIEAGETVDIKTEAAEAPLAESGSARSDEAHAEQQKQTQAATKKAPPPPVHSGKAQHAKR